MDKKLIAIIVSFATIFMTACSLLPQAIATAIAGTQAVWTPIPTQTAYPSLTPLPTIVVTKIVIWTPAPKYQDSLCKPITNMDYSDNSKVALLLQAYVAGLPGVESVSYVYPERLYPNTLSESFHVSYIDSNDGNLYSKRYIVYLTEFGWENAVFSIDGQCWIDPP